MYHTAYLSEMEDSREAIWQQLQAYIKNTSIRLQLFYRTLRNCKEKTDIISLRSDDGFTLLHEVIRNKREDLMPSLLYCGVLLPLYDEPVGQDGGEYTGLTPVDLAARFGAEKERLAMELNIRLARNIQRHPLKKACLDGNVQEFQAIIQQEPYGVGSYTDGKTCLHWAIISGSIPLVNAVLEAEANISFVRTEGDAKEVLVQAITLGHSNMIEPLLEHSHVDIDSIEIDGKRLMEKIVEYEDIESFNILQRRGVAIPETLLAIAASCGSEEFAKMLIENHCPPLEINFRDRRQKTALHFATESGHLRVIELLITNGADMKAKDKRGRSFLHSAAEQGNIEVLELVVRILETGGALQELLNSPDKHLGPELCFLVRGRDLEQPAWHYVHVDRGVLDIFRMKTRGGAVDVAQYGRVIKSGWGSNPAQEEVQEVESQFDMVNISPTAPPDMLPLHLAILKNNRDVALHLIELMTEAAINTEDCFGLTPLHYACMRGMVQVSYIHYYG